MTEQVAIWFISIIVANLGALITFFVRLNNRISALEIIVKEKVDVLSKDIQRGEERMDAYEKLLKEEIKQLDERLQTITNQLNRISGRLEIRN